MTQLQIPSKLVLKTTPKADWQGTLTLLPVPAPQMPNPDKPGQQVGDILAGPNQVIVSVGPAEKLRTANIRKAGISAAAWLIKHGVTAIGLSVSALDHLKIDDALEAFCEGLSLGAFDFNLYKSKADDSIINVFILTEEGDASSAEKIMRVDTLVSGVNLAREWSHEPPNVINPITLAERAQALAAKTGLRYTVFDQDILKQMGAGAILSVGLGSKTPSQMILLEHAGKDKSGDSPPVVVIGKAITFDTGGYSLKNKQGIVGMKFDKCG